MAVDEQLVERVRTALAGVVDVSEQRMFGGAAFLVNGHMACGIVGERLMLRLGEEGAAAALAQPHVSPMDFTGRPLKTMVFVEPEALRTSTTLKRWIDRAVTHARRLPPKPPSASRRRHRG